MAYKKILFGTDLSDASFEVTTKVKSLASENDADLYVIHALDIFPSYSWGYTEFHEVEKILDLEAKRRMGDMVKALELNSEKSFVKTKPSKTAILEVALEISADLIVVGSHSQQGIFGIVGSTASSIVSQAHCDVLVLKHDSQFDA